MQKVFHKHELEALKSLASTHSVNKIFLIRDEYSYSISGAESFIHHLGLKESSSFYSFDPNPQIDDLKRGITLFCKGQYDLIVAIGGGSVLDMAKLISFFANQSGNIEDIVVGKRNVESSKTPLLAIPTTAGTGAEATQFAVLYIDKNKYSVEHPKILPDYVYLSADFSMSAPSYLTACTGADAFCQAFESLWSVNANIESEKYALKAIEIIWNNLPKAISEIDPYAKEQLQEAAFLAGKAISITKTTAPHAISYAFTSYYGIPHGHAVALSMSFFLNHNYTLTVENCIDARGPIAVKNRIEKGLRTINADPSDIPTLFTAFFDRIGINTNLPTLLPKFDHNVIINNVNIQRLSNNPRKVTTADLNTFLNH